MTVQASSYFEPYLTGKMNHLVISENDRFMAIIEEKPLVQGHCVVFPKRMVDALVDLSDDEVSGLMVFANQVSRAIQKVIPCPKIGIAVIGLQVRHVHVHLVPIHSADDLNFTRPKLNTSPELLVELSDQIRSKVIF